MKDELRKMSDRELKELATALCELINSAGCYGVRDVIEYELALGELQRRGISYREATTLEFEEGE